MNFKELMDSRAAQYFLRLFQNLSEDYIGLLAAGVAFYFFLAAFPAIASVISIYGIFSDPKFVTAQIEELARFIPPESFKILHDQAQEIASADPAALGLGVLVGIGLTLFSTAKGVGALIRGLNIAYNTRERRNILVFNSVSFLLTFVMLGYVLFALSLIAFLPAFFALIHMPQSITDIYLFLRWPLLMLSAMIGLQMIYFYAPCHTKREWKWFSWGALVATLFWVGGSSLFSLFVTNFGKYNETYGSLGAVAVLLLWFWLSALTILLGAEINASFRPKPERS